MIGSGEHVSGVDMCCCRCLISGVVLDSSKSSMVIDSGEQVSGVDLCCRCRCFTSGVMGASALAGRRRRCFQRVTGDTNWNGMLFPGNNEGFVA